MAILFLFIGLALNIFQAYVFTDIWQLYMVDMVAPLFKVTIPALPLLVVLGVSLLHTLYSVDVRKLLSTEDTVS